MAKPNQLQGPKAKPTDSGEAHAAEVVEPATSATENLAEIVDAGEEIAQEIGAKLAGDGKFLRKKAHEMEREGRKVGGVIMDLLFKPGTATKIADEARQKLRGR